MCLYSNIFKLQSSSKYSPFDAVHLSRCLFHCSKQLLNWFILMPLSVLQFLFHPFHIGRGFSFEEFCHPGKQKESLVAKSSRRIGRVGHRGHAILVQKLLNTQKGVGRCTSKSPIMKWAEVLKVFKKHSPKLSTASHNNVSYYTDTDGLLEHSFSRESLYYRGISLQEIIPVCWGSPFVW